MRVFVAGASGAIGRTLVPKLVAAGHEVTGTTRSEERAEAIRAAGAHAAVVDVFDGDRLREAVAAARPEVLVHELTSLPDRLDFRKEGIYEPTNRVRTEGTRILLDAARDVRRAPLRVPEHRVRVPAGGRAREDRGRAAHGGHTRATSAAASGRSTRWRRWCSGAEGLEGVVLRYGFFYGPGTYYGDDGTTTADVRRRRMPIVGRGSGRVLLHPRR